MKNKLINYETVSYLVIGVLTTAVDYIIFALINEGMKSAGIQHPDPVLTATAAGWLGAVVFAFVTNKTIVFKSRDWNPGTVWREACGFFAARVISGLAVLALMWLLADLLHMNEYLAKILTSVFNVVFNYVASKVYIFKK